MNLVWTKKEFEAYVLLFAAHCNHIEDIAEQNYIRTKINEKTYHRIHTEVAVDSEEDGLKKIQNYISQNEFTQKDQDALIYSMKQVFFADGSVDTFEKDLFGVLKKIIG